MTTMKAEKGSHKYSYVNQILYDKFGNRKYIAYGNGTATTYDYDHANLRMTHLQTVTANGRLIQNNHYEYDAVGNILSLNNDAEIAEHETLYGGPTTNRYSYDNRYQLISAEGTHQGFDKQHQYNLTMEYGATGKILRKTQSNQWRKADGDWNSDAETTVDYQYRYDGQKPHAVSSITDGVTETLHTFTYDASGNNLLETNSKASSDRQMVWTEDNRLASIKARGNISHYLYDANGIRTLKMSSSSFNISVNGVAAGSSAVDGNFTIYANPYAVVRKNQYTKHYFLGTQRILTKIGNSEVEKTFFEGYAENIVPNVDYQGKQDDLESNLFLNNKELNVGWYRETRGRIPSQHIKHYLLSKEYGGQSGVNPWQGGTETTDNSTTYEEKQYFFHPDHLGSTNYLTDVTGEAYQHVAYLPWGEVFVEQRNTQSSRNTFLYTGKELDEETGLYYYEQRYMNPKFSIFLGVDPLLDKFPEWGAYTYTFNNPIRFIDPDGRDAEDRVRYAKSMTGIDYPNSNETEKALRTEDTVEALRYMDCSEFVCRVLAADGITDGVQYMTSRDLKTFLSDEMRFLHSENNPQIGDVAVWDGHVGIVTAVNADGSKIKLTHARGIGKLSQENSQFATPSQYRSSTFNGYYRPINETPNATNEQIYSGGTLPEVVIIAPAPPKPEIKIPLLKIE